MQNYVRPVFDCFFTGNVVLSLLLSLPKRRIILSQTQKRSSVSTFTLLNAKKINQSKPNIKKLWFMGGEECWLFFLLLILTKTVTSGFAVIGRLHVYNQNLNVFLKLLIFSI